MFDQQITSARKVAKDIAHAVPVVALKKPAFWQCRGFPSARTGMDLFPDFHLIHGLCGLLVASSAYPGPFWQDPESLPIASY